MAKTLYVGNLPWSIDSDGLKRAFEAHVPVISARIINDRTTGRSRGFGFVEVEDAHADAAIQAMNGKPLEGRELVVNEAKPRQDVY